MKNTLKIYSFTLSSKDSGANLNIDDFIGKFKHAPQDSKSAVFGLILKSFNDYFGNGFKKNKKGNRAVATVKDLVSFKSEKGIIHGFVKGGLTDIGDTEAYKMQDEETAVGSFESDNVLSQYYYFLIYLPTNTNTGFVILQFNDSVIRGISPAFFERMHDWFDGYGIAFAKSLFVPDELQQGFLNESDVVEVNYITYYQDDEFSPNRGDNKVKKIKRVQSVGGLKYPFLDFIAKHFGGKKPSEHLQQLIAFNEALLDKEYKLSISCRNGTETKTYYLSSDNGISPQIGIEEQIVGYEKDEDCVKRIYGFIEKNLLPLLVKQVQGTGN